MTNSKTLAKSKITQKAIANAPHLKMREVISEFHCSVTTNNKAL
jgi:hypothetical protein